jgi:hypothetical protein
VIVFDHWLKGGIKGFRGDFYLRAEMGEITVGRTSGIPMGGGVIVELV